MNKYKFQYYFSSGIGGGVNGIVEVELKDEYAKQLEALIAAGKRTLQYSTDIRGLYGKVIERIAIHEMQGYDPDYLRSFAEDDDDDTETCMEYYLEACNIDIFMPGVEWDS